MSDSSNASLGAPGYTIIAPIKTVAVVAAPTRAAVDKGTCVMGERICLSNSRSLSPLNISQFMFVRLNGIGYRVAINALALLFLETCVSFGAEDRVNLTKELASHPTQAYSGTGCRPTRSWLFNKLRQVFPHVYLPKTQPCHEEFPLDWTAPKEHTASLQRAIFIASREQLENKLLTPSLIMK